MLRFEHARRNDGGNRIGRVVEAVHEIEQQRHDDQGDEDPVADGQVIHGAGSGVFEHDGFNAARDVLAAVSHRFEKLVDFFQLDQFAHILFFTESFGHTFAQETVDLAFEFVDFLAQGENLRRVVHVAEQFDLLADLEAALRGDLRHGTGLGRNTLDVVKRNRLGDVLHHVENVVHAVDQRVDVVAVERGDEGAVQLAE